MLGLDHLRKKPPGDGGLLLDTKDRRLKMECEEVGVTFYIGPDETSQQRYDRRVTLRRSIKRAKTKMRRLEEKGGKREQLCVKISFAQKCFVFLVDSDENVRKKVQIVCDLFSRVTKPFVSKTGVAGRPHLGVPGNITGSVESDDLPEIITAYFGGAFDMEYAEKLVVEAFEEDTGLKVGSGVAESGEEEEDEDRLGRDMKDGDKG
ncbi:hypothetical protein THAOC_14817 [Thalassiosira oceanica]|uniref:Uncharacterized protein n=1 Tax=Thalassiosira oceanica TaxID=159749 RepID=K0T1T4_THAOC|nr:hypothetical protein THAOC_14817 [Thalassiosira oceanica]|eukprot:EJK64447.1 hypothetical protein THAOC_14817 [Thalassiosira oceanica]